MQKLKLGLAAAAIASLVLLPAGCAKVVGVGASAPQARGLGAQARRAEKGGNWTILVHMAADNDLFPFAAEDINEMEAGLAELKRRGGPGVRVVILYDGTTKGDSKIIEVVPEAGEPNSTIQWKVIDDKGVIIDPATREIDSGDPKISAKFAAWGARYAPADHTLLSFWDHGSGLFRNRGGGGATKGFCWDDGGTHMETADLDDITGAFAKAAGKRLDCFAMDACLMAHLELAYQARATTDYMFASEELEPGHGYDYYDWFKRVAKTDGTPRAFMGALVESGAWAYNGGSYGIEDITFSLTDIREVAQRAVPAVNEFARVAGMADAQGKAALRQAREQTQVFYNRDCADLIHFGELVGSSGAAPEVKAAAAKMIEAVSATVVKEAHSDTYPGARGLVVYFPKANQNYNKVYDDPAKIAFASEGWGRFIKSIRNR